MENSHPGTAEMFRCQRWSPELPAPAELLIIHDAHGPLDGQRWRAGRPDGPGLPPWAATSQPAAAGHVRASIEDEPVPGEEGWEVMEGSEEPHPTCQTQAGRERSVPRAPISRNKNDKHRQADSAAQGRLLGKGSRTVLCPSHRAPVGG